MDYGNQKCRERHTTEEIPFNVSCPEFIISSHFCYRNRLFPVVVRMVLLPNNNDAYNV
jgi:hypothetical protein